VWDDGCGEQFSSGVDVPDPSAYGLDELDQVVPDLMSQYVGAPVDHGEMYTRHNRDGTAAAVGWTGRPDLQAHTHVQGSGSPRVTRTVCRRCRRWTFGKEAPSKCPTEGCDGDASDLKTSELNAAVARQVPTVESREVLHPGDVVAMVRHGSKVDVLRADRSSVPKAECIGVVSRKGGKTR
jgi:hypothetical protein